MSGGNLYFANQPNRGAAYADLIASMLEQKRKEEDSQVDSVASIMQKLPRERWADYVAGLPQDVRDRLSKKYGDVASVPMSYGEQNDVTKQQLIARQLQDATNAQNGGKPFTPDPITTGFLNNDLAGKAPFMGQAAQRFTQTDAASPSPQLPSAIAQAQSIEDKITPTGQEAWTNANITAPQSKAVIAHTKAQEVEAYAQAAKARAETGAIQQPTAASTLTGEDFLKSINPGEAALIKKIANYEADPASIASTRSPKNGESERRRLVQMALQYDPTYDPSQFKIRMGVRQSFTKGPDAANITAINTTVKHLLPLSQSITSMENRSFPTWNAIANAAETATGDARVTKFNAKKQAVVTELAKVFKGTAAPTTTEIEEWAKSLSPNMSPAQFQGALQSFAQLLGGRIGAMDEKYKAGMGKTRDFQILSPASRKILEALKIDPNTLEGGAAMTSGGTGQVITYDNQGNRVQ